MLINRRKNTEKEIAIVNDSVESTQDIVVSESNLLPEMEYAQSIKKQQLFWTKGLTIFIIIELVVLLFVADRMHNNDILNRVLKELEKQVTGEINLKSGVYIGDTDFGYFFGKGDFLYNTGSLYEGDWVNNQMKGMGTLSVPADGIYTGEFSGSLKDGTGTYEWNDGTIYSGEWKKDKMSGQGTYTSSEGVVYTGVFKDNLFWEGKCEFSNKTGKYCLSYFAKEVSEATIEYTDGTTYTGDCNNNGISGAGYMSFPNGDSYTGSFKAGVRNGTGVYIWASGDKYDGAWADDSMTGNGNYLYANGAYYEGVFDKNQLIEGTYYVKNEFGEYLFTIKEKEPMAVAMVLSNGSTYVGDISDGKLSGQAKILYSNGDTYSGSVSNGQKFDQGTYIWNSGASYEGSWENDQMNGRGTYYYPSHENGYKLVGNFENGVPNGQCEYYESESKHYETEWSDGSCVKVTE